MMLRGALALMLYAVFLIATAPASVAAWALGRATGGSITLQNTAGSFWRGHADAVSVSLGPATQQYRRLSWSISSRWAFSGELALDLNLDDAQAKGHATLAWRPGLLRLRTTALNLAPAAVVPYVPVLSIVNPEGQLWLRADDLALRRDGFGGTASLDWLNAASGLSRVDPLGSYRVKARGEGKQAQFELDTPEGALQVRGRGSFSRETGLLFEGSARAAAGREGDLRDLLMLLGADAGDGSRRLLLNARGK